MIKKAANVKTAGKHQINDNVATISKEQALEIARKKMVDMNAYDEEMALRMIAGTAKQMGIKIKDVDLTPVKNGGKK
jgi:large subunit ribosomal protein L11